jgi:hypothetical protein
MNLMRHRNVGMVMLLLMAFVGGGCGLIARGNKQTVEVITDPPGAMLTVDKKSYVTPAKVLIQRKKKYEVTLTKEGYQGIRFMLHPRWDAGGAGAVAMDAIVPGGTVMFLIDTLAGADRQFNKIATIKLPPATQPTTQIITLYEHKGHLYNKAEYEQKKAEDKLFAKKKKKGKGATSAPTTQPAR